MDVVGTATEVSLSLIDKLETTVNKFYQRKDLAEDVKGQLGRIQRDSTQLRELIPQIEPRFAHDIASKATLDRLQRNLQDDTDELTSWEKNIRKAKPRHRVRRMKQVLDKCETDVKDFFEFLNNTASSNSQEPEMLRGYIMGRNTVPPNPPRLVLDYTTAATCEGALRAAILKREQCRMVGLIASGKGGMGKTCALRGLADDIEIKNNFPGGTLYIQLGNDATLRHIISGIAEIVERTGGFALAKEIRTTENVEEASKRASDWFCKQTCLFLVDDIWKVNGIDSNVLTILGSMVNETSRLVYTTRDRHFLELAHKVIEFEEKETQGDLARRMLMTHGGFNEEEAFDDKNRVAFEAILDECQGLPLAFGIAGGAVRKKSQLKQADRKQDAWSDVHQQMLSKQGTSALLDAPADRYGWLAKIVDISLRVLEENYWKLFRALCVLQKKQSAPLCMLQRLWNLDDLQETEKVAKALNDVSVVQLTDRDSILSVQLHDLILDIAKDKALKENETQSFFQTLVHNYAQSGQGNDVYTPAENCADEIVPGNNEVAALGTASVGTLVSQTTTLEKESVEQSRSQAWWSIESDGYLHNNVCRALRCAGHTDELLWLLSQPQWIVQRLLNGGISGVEQDLEEGKSVLSTGASDASRHTEHLEMIGRAARLSCAFVQYNEREVWFQLHGRLLWHATENERTREFIKRIECCAPRPWAKASPGFLQQAGGGAHEAIPSNGTVLCTQMEQDDLWFIWESEARMGVSRYNIPSGRHESTDCTGEGSRAEVQCAAFLHEQGCIASAHGDGRIILWSRETGKIKKVVECNRNPTQMRGRRRWRQCFGICASGTDDEQEVFVAFSADGTRVASTDGTHTIRIWDAKSGSAVGKPLRGHTGRVKCVAVRADGRRIVSGSVDETVRVWDAQSGVAVGEPLRGHTDWVMCVAVSADGRRIVSGSWDETLRVWDAETGSAVGEPLRGHTGCVRCVAVSADGRRIVSGSWDETLRVWDAETGSAVGEPLRGHSGWVTCVAESADGRRIVSGSLDETVRVWDAETGSAVGEPLRGHTDSVECVAVSADGRRIVSGSDDKTVRVWDAQSGSAVGEPLRGHTDWVRCVAVSADGRRIVSGSWDETVRLWDAQSGSAVGEPLRGHTRSVACVAVSADGRRIVSGSWDETVRVWDAHSGQPVGAPLPHNERVTDVRVDADCSHIVSREDDGPERLWDAQRGECVLTSPEASWRSTVDALTLPASVDWHSLPRVHRVETRAEDGSRLVLATCEDAVRNIDGGDVYWSRTFKVCRIVR